MVKIGKKRQILFLKKLVPKSKIDLFDWDSQVDGRLSYNENKRIITNKLKRRGLLKSNVSKKKKNPAKLVLQAEKINNKRSKNSQRLDGLLKARKTFKAEDLTKKQFLRWKKNKSHYDIEGIDSAGTHIKKKNLTKKQASKILNSLDFDDLI